jgi:predicted nucleotidyltransferase
LTIVSKTFGVADIIKQALAPLAEQIEWAFIFGSLARGKETSASDIDLMIIGDLAFSEAVSALYSIQETLGREINPKIYRKEEWIQLLNNKENFIKDVLSKERLDVMGNDHELR